MLNLILSKNKSIKRNYYELLAINQYIKYGHLPIMKHRLYKRSELKYLNNFRKINQTRFYKKCEVR